MLGLRLRNIVRNKDLQEELKQMILCGTSLGQNGDGQDTFQR